MSSKLRLHRRFSEPLLSFHPERENDTSAHPLRGLLQYGPYTSGVLPDPIRIATIAPFGESQRLFDFLRHLHESWEPQERKNYLERWPGFHEVFGVKLTAAVKGCRIETGKDVEKEIAELDQPHLVLADRLTRLIQKLALSRSEFDVIFIYLPSRWSSGFDGGQGEDFDLRDHLKAVCAKQSMPIQIVREGGALTYRDRASVMWRIGIATYVKAGGVPWKLANLVADVAHIGISYAVRPPDPNNSSRFVTCCSQVFDADGSGLEFIAYDTNDVQVQRSNPFLSRLSLIHI